MEKGGSAIGRVAFVNAPCHPTRRFRLFVVTELPHEVYERTCPQCGKRWQIDRRTLVRSAALSADEFEFGPGWTEPGLGLRIR